MLDIAAFVMFLLGLLMLAGVCAVVAGWLSATLPGTLLIALLGIVFVVVSLAILYMCVIVKSTGRLPPDVLPDELRR